MAVVVARPGATVDVQAMKLFLRGSLANYKQPKLVALANELPRNTMGKVQKNRLRELYLPVWQEQKAKGGAMARPNVRSVVGRFDLVAASLFVNRRTKLRHPDRIGTGSAASTSN